MIQTQRSRRGAQRCIGGDVAKSFIVADGMGHASQCIRIVCPHWRVSGYNQWIDDTGSIVSYWSSRQTTLGHAPGTVVYLGWGWKARVQPHDLLEFRARGYVVEELKND
jgi:hypothetical protein